MIVHNLLHLLYMIPHQTNEFMKEDLVVFNKFAMTIDFATARLSEKPLEIQPDEET